MKPADLKNPAVLQDLYPDELLQSTYWRERGSTHRKPFDRNDSEAISQAIDQAARALASADAVLFVTGAGAGVDMGLPDFRTSTAFWEKLAHPEISRYEDSSDNKWFDKDPEFAWGLNYHQIDMYRTAEVHAGYEAMRQIAAQKRDNYFCFTTNIDGVLQRAGFAPERVREVHGNIHRVQCTKYDCVDNKGVRDAWEEAVHLSYDPVTFRAHAPLPTCPKCGSLSRPNIWFCTDSQYVYWRKLMPISDAYFAWLDACEAQGKKIVVIEVGAGLVIPSARVEAEDVAERLGGVLIRINPTDYAVPVLDHSKSNDTPSSGNRAAAETASDALECKTIEPVPEKSSIAEAIGIPLGAQAALTGIWGSMQLLQREQKK
eukprot:gene31394-37947_t